MISVIFLAIMSLGLAGFSMNRLYVLVTRGEINVKGFLYSKTKNPIFYWFWIFSFVFGIVMGLLLFALSIGVFLAGGPRA